MDSTELGELFSRDPFLLSELELEARIEEYRKARKNFVVGGVKAVKVAPNASLADLGLI